MTQSSVTTQTETRGGKAYSLLAEYEWTTIQNARTTATTTTAVRHAADLRPSRSPRFLTFSIASIANPQSAKIVTTSNGTQTSSTPA